MRHSIEIQIKETDVVRGCQEVKIIEDYKDDCKDYKDSSFSKEIIAMEQAVLKLP